MQGTDLFFYNKVAGWVLFTFLLVFGLNELSHVVYHAAKPAKPGMTVEVAASSAKSGLHRPLPSPRSCRCWPGPTSRRAGGHQALPGLPRFNQGRAQQGWPQSVGRGRPSDRRHAGFPYSDALKAKSDDKWTYENLNHFIHKPKDFAPGTKMGFAGIKEDRSAPT